MVSEGIHSAYIFEDDVLLHHQLDSLFPQASTILFTQASIRHIRLQATSLHHSIPFRPHSSCLNRFTFVPLPAML